MRIAWGPETNLPSWKWVGLDTSTEVTKYFNTILFKNFNYIIQSDVIVVVKQLPTHEFLDRHTHCKKIYVPIDYFESSDHILSSRDILRRCDLILSHSRRLIPLLSLHCRTEYIDHHCKYTLPNLASYKSEGYALWIGGFQFVPFVIKALNNNSVSIPIKILSDFDNPNAILAARNLAKDIGIDLNIKTGPRNYVNGIETELWSESMQQVRLQECKSAFDVKGTNFDQMHKPPTKGQKYVCSGVPFAINAESETYEYFNSLGLKLVNIDNPEWLSKEYWIKTAEMGSLIKHSLSLKNIGLKYRDMIRGLL